MDKILQKYKGFVNTVDKNNTTNRLDLDNYLLSPYLHLKLHSAGADKCSREVFLEQGVYFVSFRLLNNTDKTLIYNYTYYPLSFCSSIVVYFILRNYYIKDSFKDRGYYFVVLDSNFLNIPNMDQYIRTDNSIEKRGINCMWLFDDVSNHFGNMAKYEAMYWLNFTTKLTYIGNTEVMSNILKLGVERDFRSYIKLIYENTPLVLNIFENLTMPEFSVLNSTLFIVKDLEDLIKQVGDKGFVINQGPQKWRGQINSMNSFQSGVDMDYRESLYNHYNYHSGDLDPSLYTCKLDRKHFSFLNIHKNIGNVRWFSTNRRLKSKSIKNRQDLFQENYSIIENVLSKNFNVGGVETQKDIEYILLNQENLYSINQPGEVKLKFNEGSYNIIVEKERDITQILSNPDRGKIVSRYQSEEYIKYVDLFVSYFSAKVVSKLLISYFLKILTNETVNIKDITVPGVPAITAYEYFGGVLTNKYIYNHYVTWKSSNSEHKDVTFSIYKELNKELFEEFNVDNFNARVGGYFIFCLWQVKLLYQDIETIPDFAPKTQYYYRVVEEVRKIFINNNQRVFHLPMKLPMVCKPKDYIQTDKGLKLGGYLLNDVCYTDGVFKKKIGYGIETELKEDNIIISLVNGLSKTPYKINLDTLQFVIKYGLEKGILLDVSSNKFQKFLDNPYKGFNKSESKTYRSLYSKLVLERNIISIAQAYSKVERIYFPVRLDNRTRIYCETDYFDYQKNDLAKGLITFARPGVLTKIDTEAIKYFKAFGGNMYGSGLDKKSLNYRVNWVDENSVELLNFEKNDIVTKSENKVCFVSFCFEYRRFIEFMNNKDSTVFYTYLPIQLDASCNGYQHLVLLTKEIKLLDKLNLSASTHDDDPDDFYTYILEKVYGYIKSQIPNLKLEKTTLEKKKNKKCTSELDKDNIGNAIEKLIKTINSYNKLYKTKFDRSIVKKTIMTKSYNAGIPRQTQNIIENLGEHIDEQDTKLKYYKYKDSDTKFKREDIVSFVLCLKVVLDTESPKIKELSKYLNAIVSICTKLSLAIPWTLPSGVRILESYEVVQKSDIKAFTFIKTRYTFKKYLKGEYDLDKQKRATMPNLIHSLDGSTIALLYKNFDTDLYTIHDCFAVTANNVPFLISKLKSVYRSLYSSESYLKEFDNFVRISINKLRGDKTFVVEGKYVYLPPKDKPLLFPDVNKIISYSPTRKLEDLTKSSNIIV